MKIDIVIPTLNRAEKLKNCIDSIVKASSHVSRDLICTYIYFSNKEDFLHSTISIALNYPTFRIVPRLLKEEYNASSFWNSHIKTSDAQMMMYLNDDVILDEFCIKNAYEDMVQNFAQLDGVVGIYQQNLPDGQTVKTAFGLIGLKLASLFPDKKLFCEDYRRFYLDKELEEYAQQNGKLVFSKRAKLTHLHPSFDSKQEDKTHYAVRKHLAADIKTYKKRKSLNYLWGEDFNLINTEEQWKKTAV